MQVLCKLICNLCKLASAILFCDFFFFFRISIDLDLSDNNYMGVVDEVFGLTESRADFI